jgi:hypothetical protein
MTRTRSLLQSEAKSKCPRLLSCSFFSFAVALADLSIRLVPRPRPGEYAIVAAKVRKSVETLASAAPESVLGVWWSKGWLDEFIDDITTARVRTGHFYLIMLTRPSPRFARLSTGRVARLILTRNSLRSKPFEPGPSCTPMAASS